MKTLIQPLLVAIVLSLVTITSSFASPKATHRPTRPVMVAAYKTSIYSSADGRLNIALDKEAGGAVVIRLTNNAGKELFAERVGKNEKATRLRLDVSALPDGVYQLVITNGADMTTHALTLATQPVSVSSRLVAIK